MYSIEQWMIDRVEFDYGGANLLVFACVFWMAKSITVNKDHLPKIAEYTVMSERHVKHCLINLERKGLLYYDEKMGYSFEYNKK